MNTKTIGRTIATGSVVAAFFAVTACGTEIAAPAQEISVDRSSDTGDVSTGDHKQPPDSRP